MLSKRAKGLYVEVNGFSYLVAGVSGLNAPFTLESLDEFPRPDPEKLRDFLNLGVGTQRVRYLSAHCGIQPESRFFRQHVVESFNKAKDPGYFLQLLEEQFRISMAHAVASVLSAETGEEFSADKPAQVQKSLLICGMDLREAGVFQENLVSCGIFPQSLQLSTVSAVAGMRHYLQVTGNNNPVVLVEMTQNSANLFIVSHEKVDLCRPINFGFNSVYPVIQEELGLKDERSARDLFVANTFDFREIGGKLLRRLLREINASTGFYEVQTGQTIGGVFLAMLPGNLAWMTEVIAREMDVEPLQVDFAQWTAALGISFGDAVSAAQLSAQHFGLVSLFINFDNQKHAVQPKK